MVKRLNDVELLTVGGTKPWHSSLLSAAAIPKGSSVRQTLLVWMQFACRPRAYDLIHCIKAQPVVLTRLAALFRSLDSDGAAPDNYLNAAPK